MSKLKVTSKVIEDLKDIEGHEQLAEDDRKMIQRLIDGMYS